MMQKLLLMHHADWVKLWLASTLPIFQHLIVLPSAAGNSFSL
jgi:hypothetical protein